MHGLGKVRIIQSSANSGVVEVMSALLLIWMRNSVGLSTVPCGTPDVTGFMLVVALPTTTCCGWSLKNLLIHLFVVPCNIVISSTDICVELLNAFEKSSIPILPSLL